MLSATGCSDSSTGNGGKLCEGEFCMAGEDEAVDVQISEQSIDPTQGGNLVIDDVVHVTVPAGSLNDDADCTVYHGILYDELGNNSEGTPNSELLTGGQVNPLDLFEISMDTTGLTGSINLSITYNQEILDAFNRSLGESVSGFSGFSANDLGVYYFDKTRGVWMPVYVVPDTTAHTFTVRTQYAGIYCYALKPASLETLGKYIIANPDAYTAPESSEARFSGPSLSISPTGYPKPLPDPNGNNQSPVSDYTSSCSSKPGAFADNIMLGAFQSSCYMHDWCYRYGNWTYGYSKSYCDSEFLKGLMKGCATKGDLPQKFLCKKIRMGFFKVKICIPNPLYLVALAYRAAMFIPCEAISVSMHAAVAYSEQGKKAFQKETSGCYDYKKKGVNCEVARISTIDIISKTITPGQSLQLRSIIQSSLPQSTASLPDSISWTLSPNYGILSPQQSDTDSSTQWYVDQNAPLGLYTINAFLHYQDRIISSYAAQVRVTYPYITPGFAQQDGNEHPDYGLRIAPGTGDTFFTLHSTGINTTTPAACPNCQWTTLPGGQRYYFCPSCFKLEFIRSFYLTKRNKNGSVVWQRQIQDRMIQDMIIDPSGQAHLLADWKSHMVFNTDGAVIAEYTVADDPEKAVAFAACADRGIFIITENSSTGSISLVRYDAAGNLVAGPITVITGASFTGVSVSDSGVFICAYSSATPGMLAIAKTDMQCVVQWVTNINTGGTAMTGKITPLSDGGVIFPAMTSKSFATGEPDTSPCCCIIKLDNFGNRVWLSVLPNTYAYALPQTNDKFMKLSPALPIPSIQSDGTLCVAAHVRVDERYDISLYKLSQAGEILQNRMMTSSSATGNITALDMTINNNGTLFVIGCTDGAAVTGAANRGTLDWFVFSSTDY